MRKLIFIIFLFSLPGIQLLAQNRPLFDNKGLLALVDQGAEHIYNERFDSANLIIDQLSSRLSEHPIVPMMRAMNIAWQDQPLRTTSPVFDRHVAALEKTILEAKNLREKNENDVEAIFFEMSAHGLMAEYYAQEGSYLKAMSQAKRTYNLIKMVMERTDESPELCFLAGLYNYFREMYPERHPIYKPFVWVFKSGDKQRGLIQLDSAVYFSKIVSVEAHLYTAYVYLRYENDPEKALTYIERLHVNYPANSYFKAKYIESLFLTNRQEDALPIINDLKNHERPYFRLCAQVYLGVYHDEVRQDVKVAEKYYDWAIKTSDSCQGRGEYYRSLAYIGLGRVAESKGANDEARSYFQKAIDLDENDRLVAKAKTGQRRLKP